MNFISHSDFYSYYHRPKLGKMLLKNLIVFSILLLVIISQLIDIYAFNNPYGVNCPVITDWGADLLHNIGINGYRILVDWAQCEPEDVPATNPYNDPGYKWETLESGLNNALRTGSKIILSIYNSPEWARIDIYKVYSYPPLKLADFITPLLNYSQMYSSNAVIAVEIGNEDHIWGEKNATSVNQRVDRDPTQNYANILKLAYQTVKSFNANILVLPGCVMGPAVHYLDELYQLGCKNYFDVLNIHYLYNSNPLNMDTEYHYSTLIRYTKYIAIENNDPEKPIWVTSVSLNPGDEILKSYYYQNILDISRKSGFVEKVYMYPAISENYPSSTTCDYSALIYCDKQLNPTVTVQTTAYYMYQNYITQYSNWDPLTNMEQLQFLSFASQDVKMINPGFESGTTAGWTGLVIDNYVKHSGNYSGRISGTNCVTTDYYDVEPGKLYEISGWIKISPVGLPETYYVTMKVLQRLDNGPSEEWEPQYYDSLIETKKYNWRRVRFMYLTPQNRNNIALKFTLTDFGGGGNFWLDDFSINAMNFSTNSILAVDTKSIDFGELAPDEIKTMGIQITNIGKGTLIGTVSSDKEWIEVSPSSFSSNSVLLNISVNNKKLNQITGEYSGTVNIITNGGNEIIDIKVKATCVLVKPNPYNPNKGNLTFFGSGIISGQTIIKIYTLSGELVKVLSTVENKDTISHYGQLNSISWNGKNEQDEPVINGIYLYTYESPKEKGIGKFIIINK